jgi:2-aminoadipate transaminase
MTEFARRAALRSDPELAGILAGVPPGVLSMTGGFPNPAIFPTDEIAEITARLMRDEPAVALQYTPVEGLRSTREYLLERYAPGRDVNELIVTSGGMECIQLVCQALLDPGDTVAVEAPSYLGALLAFAGAEARVEALPMDDDGLVVEALTGNPKLLYVIPEFQNPTGRTLSLERRVALVEECRRRGILIFEDVAYRELSFDGENLPTLWSLGPDVVIQAGTFSKTFSPGLRLGWALGPAPVVAQLAAVKQNTDQCAAALGQRLMEEYGRGGGFERNLPRSRELYAARWRALSEALHHHLPDGCSWTEPAGGFLTWLTLPVDTLELRPAATEAGVAYVPGRPFYATDDGHHELRLSFSFLSEDELDTAIERLARAIAAA